MIYDPAAANPLNGNPLRSREDVAKALCDLFNPLLPYFSQGGARVRLSGTAAHFDRIAADVEGFARPLWGLVPFAAGGGRFDHWKMYREGLANGMDPEHPEYWGQVSWTDQRMVEMAAIGFALRLIPDLVFHPLDQRAKDNIVAYLTHIRKFEFADNNWKFFRILIDLGLEEVGADFDRSYTDRYLEELDTFYLGDGWYRDGNVPRVDHYIPFAMHFYGLIYATLKRGDDARRERYRERAAAFAKDIRHWFDADGGTLAFGRSLTYRFACGGFWGALAFADLEALPWAEIKGQFMRHMRWWCDKPIAERDGILSVGYGYPNLFMSESYNSAGSPYWALKAFLPLALGAEHPFWQAGETDAVIPDAPVTLPHPGMIMMHTPGNVVALSSGQQNHQMRFGAEKYAKFAYGSRYAFSVEAEERIFQLATFDGMIGLSDDGRHYRIREDNEEALIAEAGIYARWKPWADVEVETFLVPASPWHLRIHRITTPRRLETIEGGFAVERADLNADVVEEGEGMASARTLADFTTIVDRSPVASRRGRAHRALPNTHLIWAKTLVPQLMGTVEPGTTVLVSAIMAQPVGSAEVPPAPAMPDLQALEATIRQNGVSASAMAMVNRS